MQDSLASTQRSVGHLDSSEQLGATAARDLIAQREKLERTERNLDEINHTTQLTQRSLNSLKSVFGGFFKNKFSKAPQKPSAPSEVCTRCARQFATAAHEASIVGLVVGVRQSSRANGRLAVV